MEKTHLLAILVGVTLLTLSINGLPVETSNGCNVTRLAENVQTLHENTSFTVTEDKNGCTAFVYSVNDSRIQTVGKNHTMLDRQDHDKDCKRRDPHSYDDGQHAGCVCIPKYYYDELTGMCTLCVPCCKKYNVTVHACINQGQRIAMCEQVKDCSEPDTVTDLRLGSLTCTSLQVTWTQSPIGDTIWDAYQISIEASHGVGEDRNYVVYDPEYDIDSYTDTGVEVGETYKVTVTTLYGGRRSYPNSIQVTVPQCKSRLYNWLQDEKKGRGYIFFWTFIGLAVAFMMVILIVVSVCIASRKNERLPGREEEPLLDGNVPGDQDEAHENDESGLASPIQATLKQDTSQETNDRVAEPFPDGLQYSDARRTENISEDAQIEQIERINGAAEMNAERSEGAPDDEE